MKFRFPSFLILALTAATASAQVGTQIPSGQTVTVDAHGECRQVTNAGSGTRMVFASTAAEWQSFRDHPNGLTMDACASGCTPHYDTWTPSGSSHSWLDVASSADGSIIAAVGQNMQIHVSGDGGVSWTATGPSKYWTGITMSDDGMKMVATAYGTSGQIYTSTDSGATWTARDSARNWQDIASSADGTKLVAVEDNKIYTSTNSGVTWTPRANTALGRLWQVASSADGGRLLALEIGLEIYDIDGFPTGTTPGAVRLSTDSGATWTTLSVPGDNWDSVAMSADGTKFIIGTDGGRIYTSGNSGATWTARESSRQWLDVASSADGSTLVAAAWGGKIYVSTDSGASWTPHESNRNWWAVASSADGTKLVAAVGHNGKVYTAGCAAGANGGGGGNKLIVNCLVDLDNSDDCAEGTSSCPGCVPITDPSPNNCAPLNGQFWETRTDYTGSGGYYNGRMVDIQWRCIAP